LSCRVPGGVGAVQLGAIGAGANLLNGAKVLEEPGLSKPHVLGPPAFPVEGSAIFSYIFALEGSGRPRLGRPF